MIELSEMDFNDVGNNNWDNKFVDKINMFLPSITHDEGEREREREGDNIDDDIEYIGNDIGNEANYIVCDESLVWIYIN